MEIKPNQPSNRGAADRFTGDVWADVIAQREGPSLARVNKVRFAPGARTAWHSHAVGQTLYVTEGAGRAQSRHEGIVKLRPGDIAYTPPNEWHWHGAEPDHFMTHLSITQGVGENDGPDSEWGALVTDAEYLGQEP